MPETPASESGSAEIPRVRISDPERMKALAHPARTAIFDFLSTRRATGDGGATATEIAEAADSTPSAMSYHLRTLARAGFIEEAPSRGDARERVWRLKLQSIAIGAESDAPPSERMAGQELERALADQQNQSLMRYQSLKHEIDPALKELASITQGYYRLTREQAADLKARMLALHEEFRAATLENLEHSRNEKSEADDSVVINFVSRIFPQV